VSAEPRSSTSDDLARSAPAGPAAPGGLTAPGGLARGAPPSTSSPLAIEAIGLRKVFVDPKRGEVEALCGLNLDCRRGEIYGMLGPNGAGKTTTLRVLATLLSPTSGTARVDGIDVAADPLEVRRRIGFLSGTTGLYARLTPRETLAYFGKLHGIERGELSRRIDAMLERFGMREYADARCESLSSGQKQKVSIARAVIHEPPVDSFSTRYSPAP
jgi:sodium transport system ATP-binding protein